MSNHCPADVLDSPKSAPNFRRVSEARICYFCLHNKYGKWDEEAQKSVFYCSLHNFPFGTSDQVPLQVEFTCDDWTSEEE